MPRLQGKSRKPARQHKHTSVQAGVDTTQYANAATEHAMFIENQKQKFSGESYEKDSL